MFQNFELLFSPLSNSIENNNSEAMSHAVRVLTVEDEFITLETLSEFLTNSGYELSGDAMNADEAIAVLEKGETDIAILDINIQGDRNGIWLADHIREHYNIPYIFLTAYEDQATVTRAMKTEPYGYLLKPFTETDVFTAIEVALTNFAKGREATREDKGEDAPQIAIDDAIYLRQDTAYVKVTIGDIITFRPIGTTWTFLPEISVLLFALP